MPTSASEQALQIDAVSAGYGSVKVLDKVSLTVGDGEFVALLGANGVGKTTLLRAVAGAAAVYGGSIHVGGTEVTGLPAHRVVHRGVAVVPQGRQLVPDLSVGDNLLLGTVPWNHKRRSTEVREAFDELFSRFPILAERRKQLAGSLSGGQQQLLAVARALLSRPRLLLLDEPSLGLAPRMVHEVFDHLAAAHASGISILLAEQNSAAALRVATRAYVLAGGRVASSGTADQLRGSEELRAVFLGRVPRK